MTSRQASSLARTDRRIPLRVALVARVAVGALALAASAGCAAAGPPPPSLPELRASLEKAELDFAADTEARGVEGWVAAFADDGAQLGAKGTATRGKERIRAAMGPVLARFRILWKPTLVEVSPAGDMGYTYGQYEVRRRDGTPEVLERGAYMSVWRREADGHWKVIADMGSEDTSPRTTPASAAGPQPPDAPAPPTPPPAPTPPP